jgi:tRNA(Ile)-lysidine synthase TilS/MesJ
MEVLLLDVFQPMETICVTGGSDSMVMFWKSNLKQKLNIKTSTNRSQQTKSKYKNHKIIKINQTENNFHCPIAT